MSRAAWRLAALALLLVGCATSEPPAELELVPDALGVTGREARLLGYVWLDSGAARLAAGIRHDPGGARPLDGPAVCLDPAPAAAPGAAPVAVSGRLEASPGDAACPYRLTRARVEALAPRDATIEALLERSAEYRGGVVRVTGALLARPGAALLLEGIGAGGAPAPGARQIKLTGPLRDLAIPQGLGSSASGELRFGQVQVEGLWRDGALVVLSIAPLTG
jgi:hypothetical protein